MVSPKELWMESSGIARWFSFIIFPLYYLFSTIFLICWVIMAPITKAFVDSYE